MATCARCGAPMSAMACGQCGASEVPGRRRPRSLREDIFGGPWDDDPEDMASDEPAEVGWDHPSVTSDEPDELGDSDTVPRDAVAEVAARDEAPADPPVAPPAPPVTPTARNAAGASRRPAPRPQFVDPTPSAPAAPGSVPAGAAGPPASPRRRPAPGEIEGYRADRVRPAPGPRDWASAAHADWEGSTTTRREPRRTAAVAAAVIGIGLALGVWLYLVAGTGDGDAAASGAGDTQPTASSSDPAGTGQGQADGAAGDEEPDGADGGDGADGADGAGPLAPPSPDPVEVRVATSSDGSPCERAGEGADAVGDGSFAAYPPAGCRVWTDATGLTTGARLSQGELAVACQLNLERDNPVFTAGQTNTWWFWAPADDGTWDWFPETALSQGVSDQSVNGIAICQR